MTGSACGHPNPEEARYCAECGASLTPLCGRCATELPPAARFCPGCGVELGRSAAPAARLGPESTDDAERRHISVLFCDLVGSTELSQKLDPEDLRELVRAYQAACEEVVSDLDGEVAQYLGDGILVYFGAPQAHEDDPVRAVRAGLQIVDAVPAVNERLARRFPTAGPSPLRVRVAVHTGPVVVGEMGGRGRRERLALGDTVNTTARILDLAEPGMVLISGTTRRLVQGIFALKDLGTRQLKGIAEPTSLHQVLRSTGVRSRLDLAPARGHTPLVGRDQEVGLLLDRWEQVVEGHGQAVLLGGEPGIGKSRLVRVLRERLSEHPHTWLECRCSPYHGKSALHPVVDLLQAGILIAADDTPNERFNKLERAITEMGFDVGTVLPLFSSLLSIPLPEEIPPLELSAEAQRQRTLEALSRWLFALVEVQPLVLVIEDLHWSDPTTLELIGSVIEQAPTGRLLLVMTFRPEFVPPWTSRSHLIHLPIHPLTRRQMATMIDALRGDTELSPEIVSRLMAKTEGVPLFVEEFTKAIVESGPHDARGAGGVELEIPSSLQASLMARIDRLGPAREVAQLCSVLGREFSHELLASICELDEATLQERIDKLTSAELIYQRGHPPHAAYTFKHALIQEIAYQSQLRARRQQVHARVARMLEERFPEIARAEPEVAVRHCEEAGLYERAAEYCLRAGERATEQAANDEAIGHFRKGIELLGRVAETPERDRRELRLQVALGVPLQAAKGNADPEVEAVYERARKLCRGPEDGHSLFRALRGLFAARQVRGELDAAIELGRQLLTLAERSGRSAELLQAHLALGSPYLYQGRWGRSLEHLESAVELYDPAEHRSLAYLYGLDQGVNSRAYAAIALFALGHPDRAAATSRDAVTLARKVDHPYSLATALGWAAVLHQMRREPELTRERAEEAISLSQELGFPTFLGLGLCYRGWSRSTWHDGEQAIRECREGLDQLTGSGTSVGGPQLLGVLADAQRRAGHEEDAAQVVDSALAMSRSTGQAVYDAELHRLKGELRLVRHGPDDERAEASFRQALEVARSQQATGWELRAATSLARLLRRRGDPSARELLEEVYRRFTEGFETPDLRDARALLAEWA